jgi:D-aminopeptidase
VAGVTVGHVTIWRDEPDPPEGRGVARTGVTAVVPRGAASLVREPVVAGGAILNGAGEMTSFVEISEWGLIETPIYLTSTHAVGRVYDGAVAAAVASDPTVGVDNVVIPVVAASGRRAAVCPEARRSACSCSPTSDRART